MQNHHIAYVKNDKIIKELRLKLGNAPNFS